MGNQGSCCKSNEIVPYFPVPVSSKQTQTIASEEPKNQIHFENFSKINEFTMTIKKTSENENQKSAQTD